MYGTSPGIGIKLDMAVLFSLSISSSSLRYFKSFPQSFRYGCAVDKEICESEKMPSRKKKKKKIGACVLSSFSVRR